MADFKQLSTINILQAVYQPVTLDNNRNSIRPYEVVVLTKNFLRSFGIDVNRLNQGRPILLLAGTSIPFADRVVLILYLLKSGYEVASLANQIGGLFDIDINPKKERVDSLRAFFGYLRETVKVDGIDIIAQSYSAFEVIRLLLEDPAGYKPLVKSITLVNPPGLNENIGVVSHCSRFVFKHVLGGYAKAVNKVFGNNGSEANFAKKEVSGISTWTFRTLQNPVRTMKEVLDIVSYRIKEPMRTLVKEYGYDFNIFLQTGDKVVPYHIAIQQLSDVLSPENIKVVPGGHNDIFIQEWQRATLTGFVKEIRTRSS